MAPKATPTHAPYVDMIKAAVVALKDRNGSSLPALKKKIAADNKLSGNWESVLKLQLRNLTKAGKLVKPAGKNTYKLGEALKKAPKKKSLSVFSTSCLFDRPAALDPHTSLHPTTHLSSVGPQEGNSHQGKEAAAAKKTATKKAPAKPKAETKAETKAEGDAAAPAAAKPMAKKASAAKPKAKGVAANPKAMAKKGAAVKKAKASTKKPTTASKKKTPAKKAAPKTKKATSATKKKTPAKKATGVKKAPTKKAAKAPAKKAAPKAKAAKAAPAATTTA
ncbi:MAG: histone H1 [Trebouxia sp. A1-2]|nr:MAG: histone H1 [Trebouxia sp. A1-2]